MPLETVDWHDGMIREATVEYKGSGKKIRKTECLYNKNISQTIQDISIKYRENINYISKVNNTNTEYRNDENKHKENLSDELYKLKQEIYEDTIEKAKAIFSVSKTGIIIENIKEIIDKKTGKKSKPNNIGFSKMVSERLGDSEAEIYFAGNMYANELVSIKNADNIISWEDEAIKHLEGSEHMFNIRRNIWNQ